MYIIAIFTSVCLALIFLGFLTNEYNREFEFNSNYNPDYYTKEMDAVFPVIKKAFSYNYKATNSLSLFDKNILDNSSKQDISNSLIDLKKTFNRGDYTLGLGFLDYKNIISSKIQNHKGYFISKIKTDIKNTMYESTFFEDLGFNYMGPIDGHNEKQLEDALAHNITRFLLELGSGFAYVGRQMELRMPNGQSYFPDMVFYHIKMRCYVVVELKVVEFMPEFAGKLNFYVSAADHLLRSADDNPTIGLLICRSKDETIVQWSLEDINRPIGVASYQLQEVVDETLKMKLE